MSISVRGTAADLEIYPRDPYIPSPSRERLGRIAYELLKETDDLLPARDLDLLAKHWVVFAEQGGSPQPHRVPSDPGQAHLFESALGPCDVDCLSFESPCDARAGEEFTVILLIRNRGWKTWSSHVDQHPVHISYYFANGTVTKHNAFELQYTIDCYSGQSGSAVYGIDKQ